MVNLVDKYRACVEEQGHYADHGQEAVVAELALLVEQLESDRPYLFSRLVRRFRAVPAISGIYIHGDVGRGKTWLLDMFYEHLPMMSKRRMHFHEFMLDIHERLKQLRGIKNPLRQVAEDIAGQVRVLCLDEFHVTDIADAMLLAGLLDELFRNDVVLVATSNTRIQDLYRDGLQRDRFLPAIELLQRYTRELVLDSQMDYRSARDSRFRAWRLLTDEDADDYLLRQFERMSQGNAGARMHRLLINDRAVPVRGVLDDVVWFRFADICGGFTSTVDYVDIASNFTSVMIEAVPVMGEGRDSEARRFINLVDALYDHGVVLRYTAEAEPAGLYTGRRLATAFARTASRLIEMGKPQYLGKAGLEDTDDDRVEGGLA